MFVSQSQSPFLIRSCTTEHHQIDCSHRPNDHFLAPIYRRSKVEGRLKIPNCLRHQKKRVHERRQNSVTSYAVQLIRHLSASPLRTHRAFPAVLKDPAGPPIAASIIARLGSRCNVATNRPCSQFWLPVVGRKPQPKLDGHGEVIPFGDFSGVWIVLDVRQIGSSVPSADQYIIIF